MRWVTNLRARSSALQTQGMSKRTRVIQHPLNQNIHHSPPPFTAALANGGRLSPHLTSGLAPPAAAHVKNIFCSCRFSTGL